MIMYHLKEGRRKSTVKDIDALLIFGHGKGYEPNCIWFQKQF